MNGGPSGFHNAPVTRAFIIASAALSVLAGIRGRAASLGLSYEDISRNLTVWRFISSVFSFSSTPEMMFGLYLLYYFRVFERQIGSNKHSVFILFSMISTTLLEVIALAQLKDSSIKVASGPYGLVFASFVPFFFDIPVSTRFHVLSFCFSDKSFIYLAGLQLLLSSWKRSILPGICGIIAGFLYRLNVFYIRRVKFPESIGAFFSRLSLSSSGGSQSTTPDRNFIGNMRSVAGRHLEVPRNYPASAPPLVSEPPEDSISTLVSMGFDRNSARQALMQARNDVNAATNILLESQSH